MTKTPNEILSALKKCGTARDCRGCAFYDNDPRCISRLCNDAADLIAALYAATDFTTRHLGLFIYSQDSLVADSGQEDPDG